MMLCPLLLSMDAKHLLTLCMKMVMIMKPFSDKVSVFKEKRDKFCFNVEKKQIQSKRQCLENK